MILMILTCRICIFILILNIEKYCGEMKRLIYAINKWIKIAMINMVPVLVSYAILSFMQFGDYDLFYFLCKFDENTY